MSRGSIQFTCSLSQLTLPQGIGYNALIFYSVPTPNSAAEMESFS